MQNIVEIKDAEYIYKFAQDIKGANISKLEDAMIETKNAEEIWRFAHFVKGANIDKLCSTLFELQEFDYILDVLLFVKVDKNILKKYIKQFILAGEIEFGEKLLSQYIEKYKNNNNEKLTTDKKRDMRINQLIEMNLIDKNDIDDYLIKVPVSFVNTKDSRLKLINLSLIYYKVLPSVVKDFKEVRENVELYLELLKKCDEKKYYYYKNAFEGKISFEQADTYYKYYLDYLLDEKIDLWGDMHHILKLKYSKK